MDTGLKELDIYGGNDIIEMINEIGPGENGYVNDGFNIDNINYPLYFETKKRIAHGIDLEEGYVPETIYWLYISGKPVGIGRLRHFLNKKLLHDGGHIGYTIRPSERGKGYGIIILRELLIKATEKNIEKVLLTPNVANLVSRKIIEKCNGKLEGINQNICKYWIDVI